jgi:hypothetical protein
MGASFLFNGHTAPALTIPGLCQLQHHYATLSHLNGTNEFRQKNNRRSPRTHTGGMVEHNHFTRGRRQWA